MDGYSYLRDELAAHVGHIGHVGDRLDDATASARRAGAPPAAFGMIGSFIPAMLQPLIDRAVNLTKIGHDSMRSSAGQMEKTVADYDEGEGQRVATFQEQERDL